MWPFKSKAKKEVQTKSARRIALIDKLNMICDEMYAKRIVNARIKIEKIKDRIDNYDLANLSTSQMSAIESCLLDIQSHMDLQYSEYILNKCKKIDSILNGKVVNSSDDKAYEQNEDTIMEKEAEISDLNNRYKRIIEDQSRLKERLISIKGEQNECAINNDRVGWQKLELEARGINREIQKKQVEISHIKRIIDMKQHTASGVISQNQNIDFAKNVAEEQAVFEQLEAQKNIVNPKAVEMNAQYIQEQYNDIKETENSLSNIADKYFQEDDQISEEDELELAFEKARETALLEQIDEEDTVSKSSKERK